MYMHLLEVRIHQENSYFGHLLASCKNPVATCMIIEISKGIDMIPKNWPSHVGRELKE